MEYPWLQMLSSLIILNITGSTWLGLCQNRVRIFFEKYLYCWAVYFSEIDRIPEACLMMGWIML